MSNDQNKRETPDQFLAKINRDAAMDTAKENLESVIDLTYSVYQSSLDKGFDPQKAFTLALRVFDHFISVMKSK